MESHPGEHWRKALAQPGRPLLYREGPGLALAALGRVESDARGITVHLDRIEILCGFPPGLVSDTLFCATESAGFFEDGLVCPNVPWWLYWGPARIAHARRLSEELPQGTSDPERLRAIREGLFELGFPL
jgi:hypothetical protein